MKKHIKIKNILALLLLCLLMTNSMVYANEGKVSLELTVKQNIEYKNIPENQLDVLGSYQLTALTEDAPMPVGSENNVYPFIIEGIDGVAMLKMEYTHGGVYRYQLIQTTKYKEDYVYDKTQYTISVYVKNAENGGLVAEVIVENGSGNKCGDLVFTNRCIKKPLASKPDKDNIQTGDETAVQMWIITLSIAVLTLLFISKRKNGSDR